MTTKPTTIITPPPHPGWQTPTDQKKKGVGFSVTSETLVQIDAWLNIASAAKTGGPRLTRGDVVTEMIERLKSIHWRPGMFVQLTMTAPSVTPTDYKTVTSGKPFAPFAPFVKIASAKSRK